MNNFYDWYVNLTDGWLYTIFLFFCSCALPVKPCWCKILELLQQKTKNNKKVSNLEHSNRNNIIDNCGHAKENDFERLSRLTDFSSTNIIVVTLWQNHLNTILPLSSTCFLVREFLIWMEILYNRNNMDLVQGHKKIAKDLSLLQFLQFRFSNDCKGGTQSQGGSLFTSTIQW